MKSLEYVKEHISEIEQDDMFDSRFTKRLMQFIPSGEWEKFGFKRKEDSEEFTVTPWTEENVLAQLKDDLDFAITKAANHRGISAGLMNDVLKAWCIVLENGLEDTEYGWYGDKLIKAIDEFYGWDLVGNNFDKEFYEEW